jgi:hypothetical protein
MATLQIDAYQEFVDFIAARLPLEDVAEFRFSEEVEARISELLTANRNRRLTDAEAAELDGFDKLEHMLRMLKFKALEKLSTQK